MMAATRGAIERALAKAVEDEPGLSSRKGLSIEGVTRDEGSGRLKLAIRGKGEISQGYDLVVDASGARSRWNRGMLDTVTSADCGTVYNTRFFRLPEIGSEQPELRYGTVTIVDAFAYGAALFQHEDGIFSIDIARLPGDRGLYRLRENERFDAAAAVFTEFKPWLSQAGCRAITNATPMAGLRNVIRRLAASAPVGYIPIGDGICTTDPTYGRGVALALGQAVMLRDRLADHDRPQLNTPGQNRVFVDELGSYVRPWYDDVVAQDIGRTKLRVAAIRGEDPMSIIQDMPLNPFMLIDTESEDPELGLLARQYVSMLSPCMDAPDIDSRAAELARSAATKHHWAPVAPSYAELVAVVNH